MTEKLYDADATLQSFNCKVTGLYTVNETTLGVELDRTAFFPEGGGQTSDVGTLQPLRECGNTGAEPVYAARDGEKINVENVEICGDHLLHFVKNSEENVKKLQIGAVLHGAVDWTKRFSDMQQHSGEHILSGVVHRQFGFNNVGFHLSQHEVTVDFDGELTENDICKVEDLVNEAIWRNLEIRAWYPSDKALETLEYRSKKEIDGPLRLVEIPGVDLCACCAPHVRRTGEIGALRVTAFERHRGGMRLWILCGERLLRDTREKLRQNHAVGKLLSCRQDETADAVRRLKEKNAALAFELIGLKKELLHTRAQTHPQQQRIVESLDADVTLLREYADLLADKAADFAAVFSPGDEKKLAVISKTGFDLAPVGALLRNRFGAKCGGRGGVLQGAVTATDDDLRALLSE
ncbi:MAG: hypothetical protein IKN72_06955 [Clostridia bacterium]|nr:hypothetical protein [Clostridia bacterium]